MTRGHLGESAPLYVCFLENELLLSLAKVRAVSWFEICFPVPRTFTFASVFAILRLRSGQALRKDG